MTPKQLEKIQKAKDDCEKMGHRPTGYWSVHDDKSWAECSLCGEYETRLFENVKD